jgi:hypothetical protein
MREASVSEGRCNGYHLPVPELASDSESGVGTIRDEIKVARIRQIGLTNRYDMLL